MEGFYLNLSFEEYLNQHHVSQTVLKAVKKSPAHAQYKLLEEVEQTPAMQKGTALHDKILRPDFFNMNYVIVNGDGRTAAVKQAKADAEAAGKTVLTRAEADEVISISEKVKSKEAANKLISNATYTELSIFWKDKLHGVDCKARLDGYLEELGIVFDIKTTRDASEDEFNRSIIQYGYHVQAAYYLRGLRALGKPANAFIVIAVETQAPFEVAIYDLIEWEGLGDLELGAMLQTYAKCLQTQNFPGYSEQVTVIKPPKWAQDKINNLKMVA